MDDNVVIFFEIVVVAVCWYYAIRFIGYYVLEWLSKISWVGTLICAYGDFVEKIRGKK
jgi:hypothetical protein